MAVLNEEQEMLRDMARDWATNESPVTEFRKVRSAGEPQAYSADAYAKMAEMGWAGIVIPEAHGGSDFGFMSAGLVVEELGKTLTASRDHPRRQRRTESQVAAEARERRNGGDARGRRRRASRSFGNRNQCLGG